MRRSHLFLSLTIVATVAAPAASAQDAEAMLNMSRSDFLIAYEANYMDMLALTGELVGRLGPDMGQVVDASSPVTDTERANFGCLYDTLAAGGNLGDLTAQVALTERVAAMAEADPNFTYANLAFDEALAEEMAGGSDALMAAMQTCGTMAVNTARFNFTPAFWAAMEAGMAAAEGG